MSEVVLDIPGREEELKEELKRLSPAHRVVFAASCCERLLPNYNTFSRMENWGDPQVLELALDEIWKSLEGVRLPPKRIKELIKKTERVAPDTEDFPSIHGSIALYAAAAVGATLECCLNGDPRRAAEVGSLAVSAVDMYVRERDDLDFNDPDTWERVGKDPLVRRELDRQRQDLEQLKNVKELDRDFIRKFRRSSYRQSNINVA